MAKPTEKQLAAFRKLGCTDEDIAEALEADAAIDRGEQMEWDLSPEEHKKAMKTANATEHKKPANYKFDQRPRKENPTKAAIITEIADFLRDKSENATQNVTITNKERQIAFKIGEDCFELTLVQKRKPKN